LVYQIPFFSLSLFSVLQNVLKRQVADKLSFGHGKETIKGWIIKVGLFYCVFFSFIDDLLLSCRVTMAVQDDVGVFSLADICSITRGLQIKFVTC
jgi:hypothetical protein